jgi:hypothetical protein
MSHSSRARDTSAEIDERMVHAYRAMAGWEKARRVSELCRSMNLLALAGIRMRHPGCSDEEALVRLAELRLGAETVRRALAARASKARG